MRCAKKCFFIILATAISGMPTNPVATGGLGGLSPPKLKVKH